VSAWEPTDQTVWTVGFEVLTPVIHGAEMLQRNVGSFSKDYTALYPRRQYFLVKINFVQKMR
jgi:hypothetical protein